MTKPETLRKDRLSVAFLNSTEYRVKHERPSADAKTEGRGSEAAERDLERWIAKDLKPCEQGKRRFQPP